MRYFNLDCHISVVEDLRHIFYSLGHTIDSWSISGHNWVLGKQQMRPEVINADTWRSLNPKMIKAFNDKYRSILSKYDGFVCTYPPAFAQIFEEYKKPIVVQIPIRYEVPYSGDSYSWQSLNKYLMNGAASGKIALIANSVYDQKYFEAFTGIKPLHIPSLCEYTGYNYQPSVPQFLYSGRLGLSLPNIIPISSLGQYQWSDLAKYKGIVVIPYNASQMSIFEYYTANMPLFCPSYPFLEELMMRHPDQVMSELSWNKIFGLPSASVIPSFNTDPNNYKNIINMHAWARYSDIYDEDWMPHIIYFNSWDHLERLMISINTECISAAMKTFNVKRKAKIISGWKTVLSGL